jgi:hypothetical protein
MNSRPENSVCTRQRPVIPKRSEGSASHSPEAALKPLRHRGRASLSPLDQKSKVMAFDARRGNRDEFIFRAAI